MINCSFFMIILAYCYVFFIFVIIIISILLTLSFYSISITLTYQPTYLDVMFAGCGFDTLYWRLKNDRNIRERWSKIRISSFVDVDFPSTTMRKVHYIKNNKALLATLNNDGIMIISVKIRIAILHCDLLICE